MVGRMAISITDYLRKLGISLILRFLEVPNSQKHKLIVIGMTGKTVEEERTKGSQELYKEWKRNYLQNSRHLP